jgi:hypothetical protein
MNLSDFEEENQEGLQDLQDNLLPMTCHKRKCPVKGALPLPQGTARAP